MKYLPLVLMLLACQPQTDEPKNDEKSQTIHQLINEYHNSGLFDGTVLIADSTGIVFQGAFGLADREKNMPHEPGTLFYLASVSKQFTATAILLLLQQEKISLEDKIMEYMPELPEIYRSITFRHLLTHTSGIPDYYTFLQPADGFTNQDVLAVLMQVDSLEFTPGEKYSYSNSGYVLLSILVETISGTRFAEFLNVHAFGKAGLNQTIVYDEHADPVKNRAVGYGPDSTVTDYRFRTTGGGGIFSNTDDLYRWHLALISGKILEPEILELAYRPIRLNQDSLVYYGFGWEIDPNDAAHVYHGGDLEGFRTWFDRHLVKETVIILLSNNSSGRLQEMAEKIFRLMNE